jgi:hypothetical protein
LADAFRDPPLSYEVQNWDDSVQAIASYRPSPLLNGWRETVTITIMLKELNDTPRGVGVTLSTTFLVNRQNTAREDYHPANAVQENLFLDRIRKVVDSATAAVCKHVIRLGPDEISCVQQ